MAKEIERKFLVSGKRWRHVADAGVTIRQGYLVAMDDRSLRVRTYGDGRSCLTLKIGKTALSRDEYEFDIDIGVATDMLRHAVGTVLEKVRYEVEHEGFTWEIDEYGGRYSGLVIAEVELDSEADLPEIPDWVGREVTGDDRYSNQVMALSAATTGPVDEPHPQSG
ncbi:CYTH domain-containing protein [Mycoplana ramosa]|uniref:CYTH domain-containing protein n=1 Tax=Mycoplana ramosa TaxID=40837 RepID=A0ABW3YVW1_MYCRA